VEPVLKEGSCSQKPTDSDSEIVGVADSVILLVGVTVRVSVRVGVIDLLGLGDLGGVKFGVRVRLIVGVVEVVDVSVLVDVFVDVRVGVLLVEGVGVIVLDGVGGGLAGSISIRTTIPFPTIDKSVVHVINIFS
jgi:hypothetical protein